MMQLTKISIPQPCHQDWQQMSPTNNGRYCEACSKTVMDFTIMTDNEIISYLSTTKNVCGRVSGQQLMSLDRRLAIENEPARKAWNKWIAAVFLLGITAFNKADGQIVSPQKTEQRDTLKKDPERYMLGKIASPAIVKFRTVTGQITDETNEPMPGATIKTESGLYGTVTDVNGAFSFKVPETSSDLFVSYIGYVGIKINLSNDLSLFYKMKLQPAMMGDIVITRPPIIKRAYNTLIRKPLRKIFK